MKAKKIMGIALLAFAIGQVSMAEKTDPNIERLLKIAKQKKAAEEKEARKQELLNSVTEEGETVPVTVIAPSKTAPKTNEKLEAKKNKEAEARKQKAEAKAMKAKYKNMSESEKMDVEIQRIKKRVNEINSNIETFHKTNEMLDKMEQRLEGIETKLKQEEIRENTIRQESRNMKKGLITIGLGALMMSCTNAKLVQYNTDRLDNIEDYLRENKFIKPSENVEKLKQEGKIDYSKEYRSLEKEADAWLEDQQ